MRSSAHAGLRSSLLILLVLALTAPVARAQDEAPIPAGHHSLVRFWLETPADQDYMSRNHLRFQIEGGSRGEYIDLAVRPEEVAELLAAGSRVEVLHQDVESFYASRLGGTRDWGVYHTYSQTLDWIDDLHALYPEVIGARWAIGQGHDGYQLWAFRVSDNPETDETDESEILFDGLHHANEIMGLEVTMMLAEYLAEQYAAGDSLIVHLLDTREIYMVPIVNPDGLIYNELTYPNGGATWRKNRLDNGDGSFGVDINRNYGFEWGCDYGSSGIPSNPTYRGPSAESEPEIQAMTAFINSRDFVIRQSYHSSGNITLYPWGYIADPTPDDDIFREMGIQMTLYNGYEFGQLGAPGVLYPVCGGSIDWDYGAQDEHTKIFGVSNELGTSQWPPQSQRQPIFEDNIWPAVYLIQMAGVLRGVSWDHLPLPYAAADSEPYPVAGTPLGFEGTAIDGSTVALHYRVDGSTFNDVPMLSTGQPGEFGAEIPAQAQGAVVEYYLSGNDIEGRPGTSPRDAPGSLHYFEIGTEFAHDMEAARGWTVGDSDDDATSGIWARIDPIATSAQPEDDHSDDGTLAWITGQHVEGGTDGANDVDGGKTTLFSPVYDLTGAESVTFGYWKWYSNDQGNDPNSDYWDVDASNDGGASWVSLEHTTVSTNAWAEMGFDLFDHFGTAGQVQLRFVARDESPGSLVEAGVDDFLIAGAFGTTAVEPLPFAVEVDLKQNYPNPFNPRTTISFHLPAADHVDLGIYDLKGRLVRSLHRGQMSAGEHGISWNGRDVLGRSVASGVYFCKLRTGSGEELTRRMVLMK